MPVAPSVAEDDDRGPPRHDVGKFFAELPECGAVIGIGVDVQHLAAEDQLQRAIGLMLGEQVGDLHRAGHERERAHLREQPLQAMHEMQGEARGAADRQAYVGEDDETRLVLPARHIVVAEARRCGLS